MYLMKVFPLTMKLRNVEVDNKSPNHSTSANDFSFQSLNADVMCSTFDHFDELNVIDDQQYGELVIEDFYETEGAVNDDEEVLFCFVLL